MQIATRDKNSTRDDKRYREVANGHAWKKATIGAPGWTRRLK
jgi:hypothetical protein